MKKLSGNISLALLKELETRGRRKVYGEGEEIFAEGEPAGFLPIVISGAVKMIRSPVAGKEMIIGIFREGEMFAVPPVVDGAPYPSSAVAIDETTLASGIIDGAQEGVWKAFVLDPTTLISGTNVLAIELHQAVANSSDLGIDTRVTLEQPGP